MPTKAVFVRTNTNLPVRVPFGEIEPGEDFRQEGSIVLCSKIKGEPGKSDGYIEEGYFQFISMSNNTMVIPAKNNEKRREQKLSWTYFQKEWAAQAKTPGGSDIIVIYRDANNADVYYEKDGGLEIFRLEHVMLWELIELYPPGSGKLELYI